MNQEKKTMQTVSSAGEYLAPEVKVVEIKARKVICTSGNVPKEYTGNDWGTDE